MAKKESKLKPWYTHFPFKGKRYVFYCRKGTDKVLVQIFAAEYAGKKFMEAMLEGEEMKWERRTECQFKSGIHVRCEDLEDILDYEYTPEEEEWQLPDNYLEPIHLLKYGEYRSKRKAPTEGLYPDQEQPQEKPQPAPRRKVSRKVKEGMVTAGNIADDLGITARQVRGALRAAKIQKPDGGWLWPEAEAIKVIHQIKKHLK